MVYDVVCLKPIMTVGRKSQGGVGMIIWKQPQVWSIESTCFNRPNVVICKFVTGKRTPLIKA